MIKALHVWIQRRGYFEEQSTRMQSAFKLMAHLFKGKKQGEGLCDIVDKWAWTASPVVWLHMMREIGRAEAVDLEDQFDVLIDQGVLDYNDCDKIFECMESPELQHQSHRLSGRMWRVGTEEYETFPNEGRMTPLLHYPCRFGLGDEDEEAMQDIRAFNDYLTGQPGAPLLEVTHGNLHPNRYLRLPDLPSKVFCYFLDDEWAREEVRKLLAYFDAVATNANPVRVPSLLRAAILSKVMMF